MFLLQNDEYSNALENNLTAIYRKSWISKYFNVEPMSQEGIVFFYNNSAAKCRFLSARFSVRLNVPEITKLYFKPAIFWDALEQSDWFLANSLSSVLHGIPSNSAPGTKNAIYDPPYLLYLKIQGVSSNYLSFNDFKKANSESTILSLLHYDEERNKLIDEYTPEMVLPYQGDLCLNEVLEFTLYDSKNQLVQVSDKSQLFILLTLL